MDKLQYFVCSVFIFIAIVISGSKVYANDGVLSGVIISDSRNSGYEITLNTDKPASYSRKNISDDKIIIKINDLAPSNEAAAIYKNASNVEHVIIKPVFNGTNIEITGKNAAKSNVNLTGGTVKYTVNPIITILAVIVSVIAGILASKKRKKSNFSTKISAVDEENKILKVAFERKGGLIAKGTGAKRMPVQSPNVRKVKFMQDIDNRELNIK